MTASTATRLKASAFALILAAGLTACGGADDSAAPADAPDAPAATGEPQAEPAAATGPETGSLEWAVAGDWRPDTQTARDEARNPVETLRFLGIEGDDTVIEVWPGGGWYTYILAPYLTEGGGTLIAAGFDPDAFEGERQAAVQERIAEFRETFSDPRFAAIEHAAFSNVSGPLAPAESADAVLTFRNLHNWMAGGYADKFFQDAYAALKPGGTLGVVEHRLPSNMEQDPAASSGYVHEDYVKAAAEAAGFVFTDSSEVNANPADTADHPFGVWTLPPVSRTADGEGNTPEGFDPQTYLDIGESDRMTLKFTKPASDADTAE